ncbi:MAG TPA: hypothetical protein VGM02_09095 [Acidobacteriaceae bacterium]|jgi:hypothetical protein
MAKFRRRKLVSFPESVPHQTRFLGEEEAKEDYGVPRQDFEVMISMR